MSDAGPVNPFVNFSMDDLVRLLVDQVLMVPGRTHDGKVVYVSDGDAKWAAQEIRRRMGVPA